MYTITKGSMKISKTGIGFGVVVIIAVVAIMLTTLDGSDFSKYAIKGPSESQQINPRGLFRLQQLCYENGAEPQAPPFEQYKYCTDSMTWQITVGKQDKDHITFSIQNNDKMPLNYTGKKYNNPETQIFETTEDSFTLRWYNTRHPKSSLFPYNDYTLEKYSREGMLPLLMKAIRLLRTRFEHPTNRFVGSWMRRGFVESQDNLKNVSPGSLMYKVYGPEHVMVLHRLNAEPGSEYAVCEMVNVEYGKDENLIREMFGQDGNLCIINWVDDNTYTLTFQSNGRVYTELWDRCSLPQGFQHFQND